VAEHGEDLPRPPATEELESELAIGPAILGERTQQSWKSIDDSEFRDQSSFIFG
jgi:hypothetical protein